MARVLCMTEFLDKDPARPSTSRPRSRSPSSGPRRPHREHTPSSSSAVGRSHSKERRSRSGVESPTHTAAPRNQFCTLTDMGHNRVHHQLSSASVCVATRLAPRDDSADHSPVFYAGGFGHPAIEGDIREMYLYILCFDSLSLTKRQKGLEQSPAVPTPLLTQIFCCRDLSVTQIVP